MIYQHESAIGVHMSLPSWDYEHYNLHFREKNSLEKEKLDLKCKQRTVTTIHDNNVYLI